MVVTRKKINNKNNVVDDFNALLDRKVLDRKVFILNFIIDTLMVLIKSSVVLKNKQNQQTTTISTFTFKLLLLLRPKPKTHNKC